MINLQKVAREVYKKLLEYMDEESAMDLTEEIIDILEDEDDETDS